MIIVQLLQESLPNKDVFQSLHKMMCGPGELYSTRIFKLMTFFDIPFFFNIIVHDDDIEISIEFWLIAQPSLPYEGKKEGENKRAKKWDADFVSLMKAYLFTAVQ